MVKLLAVELIWHLLTTAVFVHEQPAIRQVRIELGDVSLGIGDVGGAAEVVTMIEEDVLVVGGAGRHVAVTQLHVVGVFGLVPFIYMRD